MERLAFTLKSSEFVLVFESIFFAKFQAKSVDKTSEASYENKFLEKISKSTSVSHVKYGIIIVCVYNCMQDTLIAECRFVND